MELEKVRSNIRIEIHNNLKENEPMDIDEHSLTVNEEGEIIDEEVNKNPTAEIVKEDRPVSKGIFTTGINIFDKQEQIKLQERAKRFALNPDEIHSFTESDLEELHESLGISTENEHIVRFDAVHILGTDKMSMEDVLEYFVKYAPTEIEWVDEGSCNVIWPDNITAARALFYNSKVVKGMPVREPCNPFVKEFLDDFEETEDGADQSILLKNKNREIELKVDEVNLPSKINLKNSVDISEITIPIPPGHWRLGEKHPNAKCLLLRFAFKTDKKPYKTEQFTRYYKKYGSSIFGNYKNVLLENQKKEFKGIFDRNREMNKEKNPWGSLAKNWDNDAKFREKEPDFGKGNIPQMKNPSILGRLGSKRNNDHLDDADGETIEDYQDTKIHEDKKKIHKLPRMRMYADEEEEKLRRKKLIQTIKKQSEKISKDDKWNDRDLRNILSNNNRKSPSKQEVIDLDATDLGRKLRNRTKNMIFTVARNIQYIEYARKENVRSDVRHLIEERRDRSPVYKRKSPYHHYSSGKQHEHRRSPVRRHRSPLKRSPHRRRSITHKRSSQGTLHCDQIYPRHRHRRRNSDYSDDDTYDQKPKSKVAVVIKTQKKPTVASTIWSRVQKESESESSSGSESSESEEESSSSSEEASDSDSNESSSSSSNSVKQVERPGFKDLYRKFSDRINHRNTLKITMTNDHFKKKI